MKTISFLSLVALFALASCEPQKHEASADKKQAAATEQLTAEANRQVGMPAITNFTERKFAKLILELRDTEVTTYTYIVDMHGKRHFLCESIGYGIPYSTQFTNPEKVVHQCYRQGGSFGTVPQPDPNGLFMPTSSSATWVLAASEGGVKPIYVESPILVSPFRLDGE